MSDELAHALQSLEDTATTLKAIATDASVRSDVAEAVDAVLEKVAALKAQLPA